MKRAVAFILSLTVIWLQVLASAQTLSSPAPAAEPCPCCVAKNSCCCVEESAPGSTPLAAIPISASAPIDFTAVLTKVLAWTLPATPAIVPSSDRASALLSAVPLFQRNCALLI